MPDLALVPLAKYGLLGAVLAWTLWQQHRDKERLFKCLEDATRSLEKFTVKLEQLWESR